MGRMSCGTGEDVGEPGLRIDAIHFGCDDETVHGCGALSAAIGPAEQPRFSTQGDTPQASFGGVVREADAPVREEYGKARPALEDVLDRFGQVVPASEPSDLRTHIDLKIVDQWPAQHLPDGQAFHGALAVDGSLN